MRHLSKARSIVVACAVVGVGVLTGCTVGASGNPAVDFSAAASVLDVSAMAGQTAADQLAADQSAAAKAAVDQAEADKAIADKLAADQAAAEKAAADQAAAERAAADQAAAEKAAADAAAAAESAARAAAEQAAAEAQAAEEQAAEEQAAEAAEAAEAAAAEAAAAEANSGLDGWYTPNGNWVSPQTAARAIAAGIAPGETVPNYLRCGTICGEGPTSGEVQVAQLCKSGDMTKAECEGIDPDEIIAAASGYAR
ncbi:MAG: hypothetical protein ABWZ02_03900 [Nakamurella sp.]